MNATRPSVRRALSGDVAARLLELTHEARERFAGVGVDQAGPVDDQARSRLQALEVGAALDLVELLTVAADQDEPREVTAVRRQEPRLEALDLAVLLQLRVVLERLGEDLEGLRLAAAHDLAPSEEQPFVRHVDPPSFGPRRHYLARWSQTRRLISDSASARGFS